MNFDGGSSSTSVTPAESPGEPQPRSSPPAAAAAKPSPSPVQKKIAATSKPSISRQSTFTSPSFSLNGMAPVRTTLSAWQAAAAKMVTANRLRVVPSHDQDVEDFVIEELDGKMGRLVFGPMSVFNGKVSFQIKRPLEKMALTVTFTGVMQLGKSPKTFLAVSQELYTGDLQSGLRTFLFGFNFPHINLPPTSENPLISYAFSAKITPASPITEDEGSTSSRSKTKILEYKGRPLDIIFVPYVDPTLDNPRLSKTATRKVGKGKEKAKEPESFQAKPSKSEKSGDSTSGGGGQPKLTKPKLTLTTADLPTTASSNSTPIIDRPHPSMLSSAVSKTTRITDSQDKVVARLNVDLPKTRFLPGDEIIVRFRLAVREGVAMPKGFGVRVMERRFFGEEIDRADNDSGRESLDEDEEQATDINIIGKERFKVLASKKFLLHSAEASVIKQSRISNSGRNDKSSDNGNESNADEDDSGLIGGKEIEIPIRVRLPTFQTFVNDSLLPTAILALCSPTIAESPLTTHNTFAPTSNKGKEPVRSTSTTTPTSATGSIPPIPSSLKGVKFVVSHTLQITVPMSGSNNWFKKPNHGGGDLEVAIPLILGNKNPSALHSKRKIPELRLNAPDVSRFWNVEGSIKSSGRSTSWSGSGSLAENSGWNEGERFLTLKETDVRPSFVTDVQ